MFRGSCAAIVVALLLHGCAREPTAIPLPPGAVSVERFPLAIAAGGFQTQFVLKVAYPATPALDFYRSHFGSAWTRCEWSGPDWQRFSAMHEQQLANVHQQLYMWVNREERRTIMLSMRYYSAQVSDRVPDNDEQHIMLVENLAADVDATIQALNLKCPG